MGRPAQAHIDLDALRHNYHWLRQHHGGRALAVIKADAYGHGALRCARALAQGTEPADAFAVAFVAEALALREGGIQAPILVLEGAFDAEELRAAHQAQLWTVVHQHAQLSMLQALPPDARLNVWLKIDTGMHRAGFEPTAVQSLWQQLQHNPRVAELTLMSHLAQADEPGSPATARQLRCFDGSTEGLQAARSLANSAGILGWPASHRDWARPGIALYGADPMPQPQAQAPLRPVMQLRSAVFAVREVAAGQAVGYGGTWIASRPSKLGLIALGYADGYPRTIATGSHVVVDGLRCPLAGRVSMDMMMVDLTEHPHLGVGAEVECWGAQLPVNEVAQAAGTIAYELLCGVKRVPVWTD